MSDSKNNVEIGNMFVFYNPNPIQPSATDCVVRAISLLQGTEWDKTFMDLVVMAFHLKDMPSANKVWGAYLVEQGYKRYAIPDTCPYCYTVKDFCIDNPVGEYLLALDGHVVGVKDGNYYDIWDSGNETVMYYWKKEE